MNILVKTGDILDEPADVLICSANPQLNMSGGVNGAILLRGGEGVQAELNAHIAEQPDERRWVPAGSVVRTGSGPLSVQHILHAVAVDGMYDSSVELVRDTICKALAMAGELGANVVTVPALATGYGWLTMRSFAHAVRAVRDGECPQGESPVDVLTVVLRREDDARTVRDILNA